MTFSPAGRTLASRSADRYLGMLFFMSFTMSYGMSFMSFRAYETTNIKSNSL
ncbi:hypothetical protein [Nostoc sp. NMS4]|uniref:hypothetical protein n=1 Tax=Nostoc sp. NMS4 TaxID=2815390 RepID=UPI0034126FE2